MSMNSLSNKEFQKKQEYKELKSKRNSCFGTGLFLLIVWIIYSHFYYSKMPTLLYIMTSAFLIIIIIAFLYDAYRKHQSLK